MTEMDLSSFSVALLNPKDRDAHGRWEYAAAAYADAKPQNLGWKYITAPFLRRYLANIRTGRVLDAGCGIGDLQSLFASKEIEYTGVDWSGEMLDIARRLHPKTSFIHENFYEINKHRIGEFDFVFAINVLQDCENLERAAASLSSCTRSGGRAIVVIENPYWTVSDIAEMGSGRRPPVNSVNKVFYSNFISPEYPILGFHRPIKYYIQIFRSFEFEFVWHGIPIDIDESIYEDSIAIDRFKKMGAFDVDIFCLFELKRR